MRGVGCSGSADYFALIRGIAPARMSPLGCRDYGVERAIRIARSTTRKNSPTSLLELLSIGEQRCFVPSLHADIFPGNPGLALYWSSTADNNEVSDMSMSAFSSGAGALSPDDKRTDLPYRFVRDAGP